MRQRKISNFLTNGKPKLLRLSLTRGNRPHVSSVRYIWRRGSFWISTAEDRLKVKLVRKNSRDALIIDTDTPPYEGVIVEGKAELTKEKL